MSVDRKFGEIGFVALMFLSTACGTAAGKYGPEGLRTPTTTPTKTSEQTDTIFEQANCAKAGITVPKPMGWSVLEVQITPTFVNCYVTKQQITMEEDFRSGFMISKFIGPPTDQDRIDYARQLASQPEPGMLPQANSVSEISTGSFRIIQGEFTNTRNNILSNEVRRIILASGSNFVYITHFVAPKPTSIDDFRNFGRKMLDGITINGVPTR